MNYQTFLTEYDRPGAVILLEGKRSVIPEDIPGLIALGKKLCSEMKFARFRSGNAPGSDELFAEGISAVDAQRMEVIVPYAGHRRKNSRGYLTRSLDDISLAAEPEVTYHTKSNTRTAKLVDDFTSGISNHVTIKAAYLLRDTVKVIGTRSGIPKADFAIFYDDLQNPGQGGTGHTMKVCINNNVPFINQEVWVNWLQ